MRTVLVPEVAGEHGFVAPHPAIQQGVTQTFSVGVFEMLSTKDGKRLKKSKAKVRVQGPTALYDAVLFKAHEVADQLDAGTYTGRKVIKVEGPWDRFERTRAALAIYDAGQPERDALWSATETNEEVQVVVAKTTEEENVVREAFYEDTKYYNSRDRAFLMPIPEIRRVCLPKEGA